MMLLMRKMMTREGTELRGDLRLRKWTTRRNGTSAGSREVSG